MANTDGNIVIGTSVDMYGMNTGLKKIEKSVKKLQLSIGAALGIGVFSFGAIGKAALDAASDLQEVQNIVDVAFGDMAYMAEDFAKTAIDSYGMSELAAKQTAGSFMAMGKALGIAQEDAAKMAIRLTALTGDMSSFYNISQDYARVALSAVYTGETETLKRYGIVLTEANLQEYAHTLGIETKVKAMDASTKALLRYNYILQQTEMIEGDFLRTQNTWANQTRILQQRWKELLITMGNGLITILTPAIKALNNFIQRLIDFANTVGAIIGKIFGIKWQSMSAGAGDASETLGNLGVNADDAAGGLDKVGKSSEKAGKKVKSNLAPFDELNIITKQIASGAGDASDALDGLKVPDLDAGGGKGSKGVSGGGWEKEGIDSLFGLGRWLSQKLAEMLKNIDWEKIFEGARRFGRGLADFLNGLITPDLFYQVGRTIANALNTAIYAALAFGEEFNWINLGRSIAAGINGFFENFDFEAFAETINVWAKGILDTMIKILDETNWKLIGQQIGTFLERIDWLEILKKVFIVIGKAFQAAFTIIENMFEKAPIETLLISFGLLAKFLSSATFAKGLRALSTFTTFLTALGTGAAATRAIGTLRGISPILSGIVDVLAGLSLAWEEAFAAFSFAGASGATIGGSAFAGIIAFVNTISELLPTVVKVFGAIGAGISEFVGMFTIIKDIFIQLNEGVSFVDALNDHLLGLIGTLGIAAAAFSLLFGIPAGLIIAGVIAAIAAIGGLVSAMHEIDAQAIEDAFASVVTSVEGASHTLDDYLIVFDSVVDRITGGIAEINESYKNLEGARQEVRDTAEVIGTIAIAMESSRTLTEGEIEQLKGAFASLHDELSGYVNSYYDVIIAQTKADYEYVKSTQGDTEALRQEYANRIQSLYEAKAAAQAEVETISNEANAAYEEYVKVVGDATSSTEDIAAAQQGLHDASLKYIDSSLQMSHNTSEMDTSLQDAKKSFDELEGSLNLAKYGIETVDDAAAAVNGALGKMKDSYSNAKDDISERLDGINESLKTATGVEKTELEQQKTVAETRLGELNSAYATGLSGIEKDALEFMPKMVEDLEKQWEKKPDWYKAFVPKDTYIKKEMKDYISKLYGEEGIQGQLTEAWEQLGGAIAPDAEEAANQILDSFFGPMQVTKGTAYGTKQVTVNGLKDDWKSAAGDIMAGALEGISEQSEQIVEDVNAPFKDAIDAVRTTNDSHSPSVVYHDIAVDMFLGAEEGLDEESPNFIDKVKEVTENAITEFGNMNLDSAVKNVVDNITTLLSGAGSAFQKAFSTISDTLIPTIMEQFTLLSPQIEENISLLLENIMLLLTTFIETMDASFFALLLERLILFGANVLLQLQTDYATIQTFLLPIPQWVHDNVIIRLQQYFDELNKYIKDVIITAFINNWSMAYTKLGEIMSGLGNTMVTTISEAMEEAITIVIDGVNTIIEACNTAIEGIGSIVEGLGVKLSVGTIPTVHIPGLAQGAVIPANKPFMAMLGDQHSGTNIEAPLDTIKQALAETLGELNFGGTGDIVVQIDGYEIFRAVRDQSDIFKHSTGYGVL